jgi:hypothetical protein
MHVFSPETTLGVTSSSHEPRRISICLCGSCLGAVPVVSCLMNIHNLALSSAASVVMTTVLINAPETFACLCGSCLEPRRKYYYLICISAGFQLGSRRVACIGGCMGEMCNIVLHVISPWHCTTTCTLICMFLTFYLVKSLYIGEIITHCCYSLYVISPCAVVYLYRVVWVSLWWMSYVCFHFSLVCIIYLK